MKKLILNSIFLLASSNLFATLIDEGKDPIDMPVRTVITINDDIHIESGKDSALIGKEHWYELNEMSCSLKIKNKSRYGTTLKGPITVIVNKVNDPLEDKISSLRLLAGVPLREVEGSSNKNSFESIECQNVMSLKQFRNVIEYNGGTVEYPKGVVE
jgi:hypothetical protein